MFSGLALALGVLTTVWLIRFCILTYSIFKMLYRWNAAASAVAEATGCYFWLAHQVIGQEIERLLKNMLFGHLGGFMSDDCETPETCGVCHVCQKAQPCPEHGGRDA